MAECTITKMVSPLTHYVEENLSEDMRNVLNFLWHHPLRYEDPRTCDNNLKANFVELARDYGVEEYRMKAKVSFLVSFFDVFLQRLSASSAC